MSQQPSQLNARGRVHQSGYQRMMAYDKNSGFTESERLARLLFSHPDVGDFHAAAAHLMLAQGQDSYVRHAEQAVSLYENMWVVCPGGSRNGQPMSDHDREVVAVLLGEARGVLEKARGDEAQIQADYDEQMRAFQECHGRDPTAQEILERALEEEEEEGNGEEDEGRVDG